ncbi:hypothetical protein H9Q10_01760 [Eikenella sp. S3360]|uniref:Uncharacterized protein n=1 Tax=Eikenella glucosivorans TaxID=2766967 RepID=A0ABS0N7Z5_9NEIS|nr:hypothetical protein [Eikenella glucosivorans]
MSEANFAKTIFCEVKLSFCEAKNVGFNEAQSPAAKQSPAPLDSLARISIMRASHANAPIV